MLAYAGKSFDSVHWFRCEGCFKGSPVIKYTYLACLKVLLWLVFAIYGLFIFTVTWKEAYSDPWKTSEVELFAKLVNNWKPIIVCTRNSVLDVWNISEHASAAWKVNCKFCYFEKTCIVYHFSTTRLPSTQNAKSHGFSQTLMSGPEYIIFLGWIFSKPYNG